MGMFDSGFGMGFNMFSIMSFIFPFIFVFVFAMIIFTVIKGIKQWSYNNKQPVLDVNAKFITKRTQVNRNAHQDNNHVHHHSSTTYYATFEVDSGDRMEFIVSGNEYGQLAEGDFGKLTFQGTRYLGFERWQ
ncbi:hypothetical protein J2Z40_000021 [Cytobacillus eiseniae]|uniref:DUF2500 domain-containing protein n=1 Tax=Cytobacillus eiseniae TaxID=762947 RepID=A0ABS4R999_9BACI|nr:DUF2500 domain-containing protein [Cytobacillus eiseniae]MBP2239468.1 hypothetical protein [Cytobacillus eiseniae]